MLKRFLPLALLAVIAYPTHLLGGGTGVNNDSKTTLTVDLKSGEKIYKSVCKNCHGPTGKGMASFPKLVDNTAEYLADRLKQYRSGEKIGPNTALMAPQATSLTDQDIADIAAYLASL